ncbi:MAG: ACP synthase, partial [bacterium]
EPRLAAERFAARFAAKEATTKLLRVRTDKLVWRSIEVKRDAGGWCDIVLHAEAKEMAEEQGIVGLALSMSHEHEYAVATVVAQRMTQRPAGGAANHHSRD